MSDAKINFKLEKDEDGFPPVETESLWANRSPQGYIIDNIPFFTKDAINGDLVSVQTHKDGSLWFDKCVHKSGNSLIRLIFFDEISFEEVMDKIKEMGCGTEFLTAYRMMSIDIPSSVNYSDVLDYIKMKEKDGIM